MAFALALTAWSATACSQLLENEDGPLDFLPNLGLTDDTRPPMVLSNWPPNLSINGNPDGEIIVTFSQTMNRTQTESGFSLTLDGAAQDGVFNWLGDTMYFKPAVRLNRSGTYAYTLLKSQAENDKGVNLIEDFRSVFVFNTDTSSPAVVTTTPANGASGVAADTTLTVTFSEPMDVGSVLGGVSTSPDMNLNIPATTVSADNRVFEFRPGGDLSFGTVYTVTFASTIKDAAGNSIQATSINFTVGNDFTTPTLTSINTTAVANFVNNEFTIQNGFEKNEPFILTFSEAVQPDTVLNAVSFSPSTTFVVTDVSGGNNTQFQIQPTASLTLNTVYEIKIADSVQDLQNNSLTKSYTYFARINGPTSQLIQVEGVGTDNVLTARLDNNPINIPACTPMGALCDHPGFFIRFCWGPTAAGCLAAGTVTANIDLTTVQMSIARDFGPTELSTVYFDPAVNATPGGFTNQFVFSQALHNATPGTTYLVTIKGGTSGVRDADGNFMESDYTFRVRF